VEQKVQTEAHQFILGLCGDFMMASGFSLGLVLALEHPELAMALSQGMKKSIIKGRSDITAYGAAKGAVDHYLNTTRFEVEA